jgi:hypothetical protein
LDILSILGACVISRTSLPTVHNPRDKGILISMIFISIIHKRRNKQDEI